MNPRTYDDYVLQILQSGNLTRAAAALGISQPALSLGLTKLETELGFRIFNRRTSPISVTPQGRLYIDYIRRLGVLTSDFERQLEEYRSHEGGRVRVGGPIAYIESLVTDAVIRLLAAHPGYRVELKTASLAELIEMAERGDVDCFIATTGALPEGLEKRLVKRERIYLCVPADDPVNRELTRFRTTPGEAGERFDYSILGGRRFIGLEAGQPLQVQLERFAGEYGIALDDAIRVNQVSTAVGFAARGQGLCLASEDSLRGEVDLSKLCCYSLPDSISGRDIYIACERDRYRTAACADFMDILSEG